MADTQGIPPVLEVCGLYARYGRNGSSADVLRDVSFSVSQGETLTVLGPNGSGKSTLLHVIAGAFQGSVRGEVRLLGKTVNREPQHRRAQTVAMVHQDTAQGTAAHLTLREHCDLTSARFGRSRVAWENVQARLEILGTTLDSRQLAGELSGGQRQLFTVLLAVLSAPQMVLLDEPTSSLDTKHAGLVLDVIREFSSRQHAAMFVTHDLSEALLVGNRLLVLNGRGEAYRLIDEQSKGALTEASLRQLLSEASVSTWTQRSKQELSVAALPR